MVGPILGAKLADVYSLRAVFGFASAFAAAALLVLLAGYEESLDPAQVRRCLSVLRVEVTPRS
jgi:hypothetical protein